PFGHRQDNKPRSLGREQQSCPRAPTAAPGPKGVRALPAGREAAAEPDAKRIQKGGRPGRQPPAPPNKHRSRPQPRPPALQWCKICDRNSLVRSDFGLVKNSSGGASSTISPLSKKMIRDRKSTRLNSSHVKISY